MGELNGSKRMSVAAAATCLALLGGAVIGGAADAKRGKKRKSCNPTVEKTVIAAIPDRPSPDDFFGVLATPIEVTGKACKGKKVANVDVTFQTTGLTGEAAEDLFFRLTSPDGRTFDVTGNGFSGQSIGPVTLTARTNVQTCFAPPPAPPPPCLDPDVALNPPYQGTARDADLPSFNGAPVRGTWTFTAFDFEDANPSVLNLVELAIFAQKPIK